MAEMTLEQQFQEFIRTHHPELAAAGSRNVKEPEDFHARRIIPTPYQEYPKLMYSPTGEKPRKVEKKKEQERLEDEGWSAKPFPGQVINPDGSVTISATVDPKAGEAKKAN